MRISRSIAFGALGVLVWAVWTFGGPMAFTLARLTIEARSTRPIHSAASTDGLRIAEICWTHNGSDGYYFLVIREPEDTACSSVDRVEMPPVEMALAWISPDKLQVVFPPALPQWEKPTKQELDGVHLVYGGGEKRAP